MKKVKFQLINIILPITLFCISWVLFILCLNSCIASGGGECSLAGVICFIPPMIFGVFAFIYCLVLLMKINSEKDIIHKKDLRKNLLLWGIMVMLSYVFMQVW